MRRAITLAALILAAPAAAQDFVLALEYQTDKEGGEYDSRSSSSGRQAIAERIIAVTGDGVEAEYTVLDAPEDVRGNERWMFPARIRFAADGGKDLLNRDELAERNAAWLAEAKWPREVCSRWLFTWTAIQIRCDPEAAVEAVESFGMHPGRIAEGQPFVLKGALGPVVLARTGGTDGRSVLTGSGPVDVAYLRESAARQAMVVAEITGKTLTLEEAQAQAAAITGGGMMSVTFEVDAAGLVWKRTDRSEMIVTGAPDGDETRRRESTVTRLTRDQWDRRQAKTPATGAMADPNPEA